LALCLARGIFEKAQDACPLAHIPCGFAGSVLEEAHGICALAGGRLLGDFVVSLEQKNLVPPE
jgi:hypothetical protein